MEDEKNAVKYVGLPLLARFWLSPGHVAQVNLHYEAIAFQHHGVKVKPEVHHGMPLMPCHVYGLSGKNGLRMSLLEAVSVAEDHLLVRASAPL